MKENNNYLNSLIDQIFESIEKEEIQKKEFNSKELTSEQVEELYKKYCVVDLYLTTIINDINKEIYPKKELNEIDLNRINNLVLMNEIQTLTRDMYVIFNQKKKTKDSK